MISCGNKTACLLLMMLAVIVVLVVAYFMVNKSAIAGGSSKLELLPGTYQTPAAGRITFKGRNFLLADINPVGKQQKCRRSGRTYLCGFYGWQSFETYLRNKRLRCTVVGQSGNSELVRCRVVGGTRDLGIWLIKQGFARALGHAPGSYRDADADAKQRQSGIHSRP